MQLTSEQLQNLQNGNPVNVSIEGTECVLLSKTVFDKIQSLLYVDGEWSPDEMRSVLARSAEANGWNEPGMDEYDRYDQARSERCQ